MKEMPFIIRWIERFFKAGVEFLKFIAPFVQSILSIHGLLLVGSGLFIGNAIFENKIKEACTVFIFAILGLKLFSLIESKVARKGQVK